MAKAENPFKSELGKNWKCPYCGAYQVLLDARYDTGKHKIAADASLHGKTALQYEVRVCAIRNAAKCC